MIRKHILAIGGTALLAVAAVAFFIVGRPKADAYASVLPKESKALARIDPEQLVKEAHLSATDRLTLLKRLAFSGDERSGIDMSSPFYAFIGPSGDMGGVARLKDAGAFTKHISELHAQGRATEATHQRDLTWALIDGQWLVAYDDEKVLAMLSATAADDYLRAMMTQLMRQKRRDSGVSSDLFDELTAHEAPMSAVVSATVLPPSALSSLHKYLPVSDLGQLRICAEAHAESNVISLDIEASSSDDDFRMALDELGQVFAPIRGSLTRHAGTSPLLWACASVRGDKLLELLRNSQDARFVLILLNAVADVDAIIKEIDGDIAVEVAKADAASAALPPFLLTAELVENSSSFSEAPYWLKSAAKASGYDLQQTSPMDFVLSASDIQCWFGKKDNVFYASTDEALTRCLDADTSAGHHAHGVASVSGQRLFATLNLTALDMSAMEYGALAAPFLRDVQKVELRMSEVNKVQLRIIAPEGVNIARSLILSDSRK